MVWFNQAHLFHVSSLQPEIREALLAAAGGDPPRNAYYGDGSPIDDRDLDQIRALLTLGGPGKASCAEVREIAEHHIEDISAKIDDLTRLKRLLRKTVAQCSGGKAPDCPVLDILDSQGFMAPRVLQSS